jgi:hypothetical protein
VQKATGSIAGVGPRILVIPHRGGAGALRATREDLMAIDEAIRPRGWPETHHACNVLLGVLAR